MIKLIAVILFFCFPSVYAQTDWIKWEKADLSYSKNSEVTKRDYSLSEESFSDLALKSLASVYWFLISDVDGDNCPFRPTCSGFLIEAVKETNFPQGTLMFFDRFTRDLNIFGRMNHYPRYGALHFYDPVDLYTLNEDKIQYLPSTIFIKSE
ncbi:MAG: membrane protein insertion efficiency factor YidD [Ignavibacteriales bacterium]|nr:membrane protein insertion efficiency factor YidD [Ignavibacteriales bacterium]